MTIAEQIERAKADYDEVYGAGFAAGQAEGGTDERFKAFVEGTIEELNDDTITKVRQYAFYQHPTLKSVTLNRLETGAASFFNGCSVLETVNLPVLKSTAYTGFTNCKMLKNANFPSITSTGYGSFIGCSALEFLDLPQIGYIESASFQNCAKLKTLILRKNAVVTLSNQNVLVGTPFRNGEGGTVYVPQALVESYETATNWNALESTTFLPIEGSEYE